MRRVIRLGDRTSHGGYVVAATSHFTVMGIDVARLGDKCTCPKKGHNNCYIVEGDPDWTIDGIAVALEGHKLSCGAVLISSMPNAGREESAGSESGISHAAEANLTSRAASQNEPHEFDRQFQLINQDGHPLDGMSIHLIAPKNQNATAKTDASGKSPLVFGSADEDAALILFQDEEQ